MTEHGPKEWAEVPIRVLVIDDQRSMRSIVRRLLSQVGITDVEEAENGEQALALLRQPNFTDPDVIICDLHMDHVDGLEFCNQVRRDESIRNRAIPILVLTGDLDTMIRDVSIQVGATAVLAKPISAIDLLKEIHDAIGFSDDG